MATRTNLDMDVLRTFVTGFELGSFALAAKRLGRSPSAVSTQLRKLEDQLGQPLVRKSGRGLVPTTAGESLLSYARRLLALNDEAVASTRGEQVEGWVRLGLPQDFAAGGLPAVLNRFAQAHPKVRVEVHVERGLLLVEKTRRGELDLALVWSDGGEVPHAERVAEFPVHWIGRPDGSGLPGAGGGPLPLVAFAPPCAFRAAAVAALDAAGLAWRLAFTSPSLSGIWAAAEGGLGVAARSAVNLPKALAVLDPVATGLPVLPAVPLSLHRAEAAPAPAVGRLADILIQTVRDEAGAQAIAG